MSSPLPHSAQQMPRSGVLLLALLAATGCASARPSLARPSAEAAAWEPPRPEPAPLNQNLFTRDYASGVSEDDLRRILDAPTYLESGARIGVIQVHDAYAPDDAVPVTPVPAALTETIRRIYGDD